MLASLRSVSYSISPGLMRKGYPTFQPIMVRHFARRSSQERNQDRRDKEPIIVEIIDNTDKHKEKMKAENRTWTPPEENRFKPPSFAGSLFNLVQNGAKAVANRVSNTFFPDEETRIKNEMKKKVNDKIDETFKAKGILGHLIKQGMKVVSNQMVSAMVDMERNHEKLEIGLEYVMNRDSNSKRLLGVPVQFSDILALNSVMGDDGRTRRGCQEVTYQVMGSHNSGIARVTIDNVNDEWVLRKVLVTVDGSNEMFEADVSPMPAKEKIIDV